VLLPLALATLALAAPLSQAPTADCGQAATPVGGGDAEPTDSDVRFGAFRLLAARAQRDRPSEEFERGRDGKYRGQKIAAALRPGRRARLWVARGDRDDASLLYARPHAETGGRYRVSQGRAVERFESCADRKLTVWPGYVVVRGARCVRLRARVDGRTIRRRVAFGTRTCDPGR